MRLTAEIDRCASGKAGGRCFGPRFTNVLHVVQQFAALGDVVIGGSQNIIACGIWSLVRMALLSLTKHSSYLEKLSMLMMDAGRFAPRYQDIALLYPRSERLQSDLCEYFIVMVRLCHHFVKYTQKSTVRQYISTLGDSDITTFQSDLNRWASSIREEIHLLMAKKVDDEAQENSWFRALSLKHSKFLSHQQKIATNLRVLNLCSQYNHELNWKQTRKIGNTDLFCQDAEYQAWKGQQCSSTLIYTGKLGSGKSVLLANIVDDLHLHCQERNATVAYFFCRYDNPESLKARTIVGSLARQLLLTVPDLMKMAELLDEIEVAPEIEKILDLLPSALPAGHGAYFILDGLDECERPERDALSELLQKLQETIQLRLCISFRVEPNIPMELSSELFTTAKITSIPDDNPIIADFIEEELGRRLESGKLVLGDPTIILEIQKALLELHHGMFLWTTLQIEAICHMKTDQAIRDALADLPKDLSETFSRILRKSEGLDASYQKQILQLIAVAYRPLTTNELREALSVIPGDDIRNPSTIVNNIYSALASCGCLLIVDEEDSTVRFIHHSVKQFLLDDSTTSKEKSFTNAEAHTLLAEKTVTYLNYGIFGTQLSTNKVPQLATAPIPSKIVRSTMDSSSKVQSLALKLLRSKKHSNFDMGKTLAEIQTPFQSRTAEEFHFHPYATSHWQQHVLHARQLTPVVVKLLPKLSDALKERLIFAGEEEDCVWFLLSWSIENGHESLLTRMLMPHWAPDTHDLSQVLSAAVSDGSEAIVRLLISRSINGCSIFPDLTIVPDLKLLREAASRGHVEIAKFLLENSLYDPMDKAKNRGLGLALSEAVSGGHDQVVKLLFEYDGLVDYEDVRHALFQALLTAAEHNYDKLLKLLLDNSDKIGIQDKQQMAPILLSMAEKGNEQLMQQLLDQGVSIHSKDENGYTPLHKASIRNYGRVISLLVKNGAVIHDEVGTTCTALHIASSYGNVYAARQLLKFGADPNAKDLSGRTPLHEAASCGNLELVKLLIGNGAKTSAEDRWGDVPLDCAQRSGHEDVSRLLRRHKIKSRPEKHQSREEEVIEMLDLLEF